MNYNIDLDEAPYTQSRREFVTLTDSEHEQLFNLTPIRNEIHQFMCDENKKAWAIQEKEYLDRESNLRAQMLFSTQLLASYGISLPQVEHLLKLCPDAHVEVFPKMNHGQFLVDHPDEVGKRLTDFIR